MAILKIARMGHPVLKRVADPVSDPTSAEVRRLVSDMLDTLEDADGTGLAAPQVHVPRRIVIFYVAGTRARRPAADQPAEAQGPSGAAPVEGAEDAYGAIVRRGLARVVGFEPIEEACDALNDEARGKHLYLPL
ncbi:MAG: peptide deformylase, partial [Kiloniellaceae bacterium]